MSDGEFSVVVFFPDGTHAYRERWIDGETAVRTLKRMSEGLLARNGLIEKIIVTDGGDCTNVEWQRGKGLTYPTPEMLKGKR